MSATRARSHSTTATLGSSSVYSLRGWVDGPGYAAPERLHAGSMSRLWPLPGLSRRSSLPCDAPSLPAAVGELLGGGFCECLSDISEVASTYGEGDDVAASTQLDGQRHYLHQPITTDANAIPEWSRIAPSFHPAAVATPQPHSRHSWRALGRRLSAGAAPSAASKRLSTTTQRLARSISAPFSLGEAGDQPAPSTKRRRTWLDYIGRRLRGSTPRNVDEDAAMPIMAPDSPGDNGLGDGWDGSTIPSRHAPGPQPVPEYPRLRSQPPRPSVPGPCGGRAPTPSRPSVPSKRRMSRFFLT